MTNLTPEQEQAAREGLRIGAEARARGLAVDAYLDTVKRLEPDITPVDLDGAMASIAISLRRIANSLEEMLIRGLPLP